MHSRSMNLVTLMRLMTETQNPATRIGAGLPAGFTAAHKTGTWGAIAAATRRVVDGWRRGEAVCAAHRRR